MVCVVISSPALLDCGLVLKSKGGFLEWSPLLIGIFNKYERGLFLAVEGISSFSPLFNSTYVLIGSNIREGISYFLPSLKRM